MLICLEKVINKFINFIKCQMNHADNSERTTKDIKRDYLRSRNMEIRELLSNEYEMALQLAWTVFQEYEGPDYSEQGIKSFYDSLHDTEYIKRLRIYGAFEHTKLIGMLATRSDGNHIALFFVDGKYHRKGIGKQLFEKVCLDNSSGNMTVNSSPFAVKVYHHLGFIDSDIEQVTDGLRYTPMIYRLKKDN